MGATLMRLPLVRSALSAVFSVVVIVIPVSPRNKPSFYTRRLAGRRCPALFFAASGRLPRPRQSDYHGFFPSHEDRPQ